MGRRPRAGGGVEVDRERRVVVRLRIIVAEIVDHLLDPHRVLGRKRAALEEAPDVRIRGGIDVDGEGRERIARRGEERVFLDDAVARSVEIRSAFRAGEVRSRRTARDRASFRAAACWRRATCGQARPRLRADYLVATLPALLAVAAALLSSRRSDSRSPSIAPLARALLTVRPAVRLSRRRCPITQSAPFHRPDRERTEDRRKEQSPPRERAGARCSRARPFVPAERCCAGTADGTSRSAVVFGAQVAGKKAEFPNELLRLRRSGDRGFHFRLLRAVKFVERVGGQFRIIRFIFMRQGVG